MRAILLVALLLYGCGEPKYTAATDNPDYELKVLFDHDSCRAYRFHDRGQPVYFVRCNGAYTEAASSPKRKANPLRVPTFQGEK